MKTSKITLSALILSALLFVGACSKSDDDNNGPNNPGNNPGGKTCLLTQENAGDGDLQAKYEYDGQNRIVKVTNYDDAGAADGYSTFTYSAGKVVLASFDNANVKEGEITYTIGTNNLATKGEWTESYDDGGFTYTSTMVAIYQYDNGYMVKSVMESTTTSNDPENPGPMNSRITIENTYSAGNMTATKETFEMLGDVPFSGVSNSTFEYYTDKEDNRAANSNAMSFIGKGSKNLVKKATHTSDAGNIVSEYTYEVNSDKQVTKETETSGGTTSVTTFTYTCK